MPAAFCDQLLTQIGQKIKIEKLLTYKPIIPYFSAALKQKRPFRRNGLTSNDCLPYEKFESDLGKSPLGELFYRFCFLISASND